MLSAAEAKYHVLAGRIAAVPAEVNEQVAAVEDHGRQDQGCRQERAGRSRRRRRPDAVKAVAASA
jgi:hypothetical protein